MAKSIVKSNVSAASATIKLGEAQRQLLSAAALRDDRCLTRPTSVRGAQIARLSETLIEAGYAREVRAKAPSPVWRRAGDTGAAFALKLTAAGIMATAADAPKGSASKARLPQAKADAGSEGNATAAKSDVADFARPKAPREFARGKREAANPSSPRAQVHGEPRSTSKIAAVIGLLSRAEGRRSRTSWRRQIGWRTRHARRSRGCASAATP